ncbi:hypothetical protein PR048_012689 [Dryococelus australis]|uniref:Uncharacterized protein n=1 Tax=Dryococelus australis TaxID=614101 RepID=A0ABQ9HRI4_9NEOP|nr:hypothetical protein PR048_012689 [Dryococelus australis]
MDPEIILALSEIPQPTTSELQQFLGIVNFSALFLPGKPEILEPLFSHLKKDTKFVWGSQEAKLGDLEFTQEVEAFMH